MDTIINIMEPRVTVLIPCYNMEFKISRMLDSLLSQTYTKYKLLIVDDGSKDGSRIVVDSYIPKFLKKGIKLSCIQQENQGAASAINNGLKYIDTEYFCIPDADDFLSHLYLQGCTDYMDTHLDCGIVFTRCHVFFQDNLKYPICDLHRKDHFSIDKYQIFNDFIWDRNVYFCPQYMIRTKMFITSNNGVDIIGGKYGQNYQFIMPLIYHTKIGYIDIPLYNYIIYSNSDSHAKKTLIQQFNHIDGSYIILNDVFQKIKIGDDERRRLIHEVEQKNLIKKAFVSCKYNDIEKFYDSYCKIDSQYLPKNLTSIYNKRNIPLFFNCYSFMLRLKDIIKNKRIIFQVRSLKAAILH